MRYVLRAAGGWSGDLLIADCEDLETLSASDIHVRRLKHQEVSQEGTLSFPCAGGALKLFDLPGPHRGIRPTAGNLEQDGKEEMEHIIGLEHGW